MDEQLAAEKAVKRVQMLVVLMVVRTAESWARKLVAEWVAKRAAVLENETVGWRVAWMDEKKAAQMVLSWVD